MKCPFCIKICTKCKRILVANTINFHKDKIGKYGLKSYCKRCEKEKKKKYYDNNKEEINTKIKKYRKDNKKEISKRRKEHYNEHKEEIIEKNKEYYNNNKEEISKKKKECYDKHREEISERNKKYYNNNKEEIKENNKEYRKNNPNKYFNYSNKRRQLKDNQGNGITKNQWLEMMQFFEWRCAYSGIILDKNNRSIDHVVPLTNGGLNESWNCIPMLKNYNSSKSTKNMEDWYMQQDFFDIDRLLKIYEWIEYAYNKWGVNND